VRVKLLLTQTCVPAYCLSYRSFSDRMTRFSDPVVVVHDFGAYHLAHGSWLCILVNPNEPSSEQRCSSTSGIPQMVSTCGCDPLCRPTALTSTLRWEYLTTLDFELDVIQRRRPYRWTIWVGNDRRHSRLTLTTWVEFPVRQIYSLTRVSTLMAVILSFVSLDTTTPLNCQAGVTSYVCLKAYKH
jgi:hypothetical protein